MIYSMPYNKAIMDLLPVAPTTDQRDAFLEKVSDGLRAKGYALGPMGVFIGPGPGEIMVDVDRDPRAEWVTFVPPAQGTKEKAAADQLKQLKDVVLPALKAGTAQPVAAQKALGWLVERELARMDGG